MFAASRAVCCLGCCVASFFGAVAVAKAQTGSPVAADVKGPYIIEGVNDNDVFGIGRSIIVRGTVKHGAMAFGGDVIVEGIVEGDVAAVGGSVKQLAGSRIGGDVLVIGG